jgi:hypothetical protein
MRERKVTFYDSGVAQQSFILPAAMSDETALAIARALTGILDVRDVTNWEAILTPPNHPNGSQA